MLLRIPYKSSVIACYKYGAGKKLLFCFHGYGESGNMFSLLEPALEKDYTLYAMDFPLHGKTEWRENTVFTIDDLLAILLLIQQRYEYNTTYPGQPFSLLGYSLGGRVSFCLMEKIPQLIKHAVLIAADGMHKSIWYRLGVETSIGRKLFAQIPVRYKWFLSLATFGRRIGIVSKSILSLVTSNLESEQKRKMLYERTMMMSRVYPDIKKLNEVINAFQIPTEILLGEYDGIIPPKRAGCLTKNAPSCLRVIKIKAGHTILKEKNIPLIADLLV